MQKTRITMPSETRKQEIRIWLVWAHNLQSEFTLICDCVDRFPLPAMDIEFLALSTAPASHTSSPPLSAMPPSSPMLTPSTSSSSTSCFRTPLAIYSILDPTPNGSSTSWISTSIMISTRRNPSSSSCFSWNWSIEIETELNYWFDYCSETVQFQNFGPKSHRTARCSALQMSHAESLIDSIMYIHVINKQHLSHSIQAGIEYTISVSIEYQLQVLFNTGWCFSYFLYKFKF